MKLTLEEIKELQDKYLGKRIRYEGYAGECTFLGYNPFCPSWELQLTINRTPLQDINPDKIKLHENN